MVFIAVLGYAVVGGVFEILFALMTIGAEQLAVDRVQQHLLVDISPETVFPDPVFFFQKVYIFRREEAHGLKLGSQLVKIGQGWLTWHRLAGQRPGMKKGQQFS